MDMQQNDPLFWTLRIILSHLFLPKALFSLNKDGSKADQQHHSPPILSPFPIKTLAILVSQKKAKENMFTSSFPNN